MKHVKTKARKMTRHDFWIILAKHEKVATQHQHGNRNQIHAILQKKKTVIRIVLIISLILTIFVFI